MKKKEKISKQFSGNFLNNLKEKNVDSEVYRTFKFIRHKDDVRRLKEGEIIKKGRLF